MDTAPNWVERGLPLIRPIAESLKRKLPAAIQTDDLIGAGRLALVQIARDYDPGRGVPFETWARFKLRGAMIDSVKRGPFREAKHAPLKHSPPAPGPSPEEAAARSNDLELARRALSALSDKQRVILTLLFVDGLSIHAAAAAMNLQRPDAVRARRQAIERLRRFGPNLNCGALEHELTAIAG